MVAAANGIISAIREHICPNKALPSACVAVRIDEPPVRGVIVAGLEIIETGFCIVVVPAIAERVLVGHGAGLGQEVAPCVVLIGCYGTAGGSDQLYDVALEIQNVVIRDEATAAVSRVVQCKRLSRFVVEEVQNFRDTAVYLHRFPNDLAAQRQVLMRDSLRRNQHLSGVGGLRFGGIAGCIGSVRGIVRLSHILRLNRFGEVFGGDDAGRARGRLDGFAFFVSRCDSNILINRVGILRPRPGIAALGRDSRIVTVLRRISVRGCLGMATGNLLIGREVPEMPLTGNFPPTWWYGYDGLFCSAWDETTKIIYCNSEFRL